MANPYIPFAPLQRLRGSLVLPGNAALNVTGPYLAKRGITLAFSGDATTGYDVMTGVVMSQEPYVRVSITIYLVKTTTLATQWKLAMENNSLLGNGTLRLDAPTLTAYSLSNLAMGRPGDLDSGGSSPDFPVGVFGTYYINSTLYGG